MRNLELYLADLKSTEKNTIETVEKSLTDMYIRLVRLYPCLSLLDIYSDSDVWNKYEFKKNIYQEQIVEATFYYINNEVCCISTPTYKMKCSSYENVCGQRPMLYSLLYVCVPCIYVYPIKSSISFADHVKHTANYHPGFSCYWNTHIFQHMCFLLYYKYVLSSESDMLIQEEY